MKTIEDGLKLELDTWDDPGDAGSGPLPSYTFVAGIHGKIVVELDGDDVVELPVTVEHVQAYVDSNPGEVEHGVPGLTVAKWSVDKVDGKRVELTVSDVDGAFEAEGPIDDDDRDCDEDYRDDLDDSF